MDISILHYMVVEDKTLHKAIWELLESGESYKYIDLFEKDDEGYSIDNETSFTIAHTDFDKVVNVLSGLKAVVRQAKKEKCGWIRVDNGV